MTATTFAVKTTGVGGVDYSQSVVRIAPIYDRLWVHGDQKVAPIAGTVLVSKTVPSGVAGFIYGIFISCEEGNEFMVRWRVGGALKQVLIIFGSKGTIESVDDIALNNGLPADETTAIEILNVSAGGVGKVYQAGLLYGQESKELLELLVGTPYMQQMMS
jgi:hypothetical protein